MTGTENYPYESESHSVMSDSVTPCTIQSIEFSRPEYWSGLPFPSPGDLPDPGIEPESPALHTDSLSAEPQGKPRIIPEFFKKAHKEGTMSLGEKLLSQRLSHWRSE